MNMREIIEANVYCSPSKLAEMVVDGRFKVFSDDAHERMAAALVHWVAGEAHEFVDIDNEDDWPLLAEMADLAATAMLAQRDAENWAAYVKVYAEARAKRFDADGAAPSRSEAP